MMKLIYFEISKLFHRKIMWVIIIGMFITNGLLVHYRIHQVNEEGYSIKDVATVYSKIEEKTSQEQLLWLEVELQRYYQGMIEGGDQYTYGMDRVYHLVHSQIKDVSTYDHYLMEINEQAEKMMKSSIFAAKNTFSYKNLVLTPQAYAHLKGSNVISSFSHGVRLVTDHALTDAFLLLSLVILAMHLLISEREEGTVSLLKATKLGREETMLAKATVLLLFSFFLIVLFYATNLVIAANEIGLGNIERPIQALDGYLSSPLKINVWQYIGLFFVAKFLGMFGVLCCFFFICIICRNSIFSCLSGIALFGLETLLWKKIAPHSLLSPLSHFNLIALLDTSSYFSNYVNINLFGQPINIKTAGIATAFTAIIFGVILGIQIFAKETTFDVRRIWTIEKIRNRMNLFNGNHLNLLRHEAYKLLVVNKGLLILLIFIFVQLLHYNNLTFIIDQEEFHYRNYSMFLEGELTIEKQAFLKTEQKRFESLEEELVILYEMYENKEIDEKYLDYRLAQYADSGFQQRAFQKAQNQYKQLGAMLNQKRPVAYVYQTGWSKLFGSEAKRSELMDHGKLFIVLILGLSSFGAIEKMKDMDKLIKISKKGIRAVMRRKLIISAFFSVTIAIITFIPRIISVFQTYGANGLSAPVISIMDGAWGPIGLTIRDFFLLTQGKRLCFAFLASIFIVVTSYKTGNAITTMLISSFILLLPIFSMLLI